MSLLFCNLYYHFIWKQSNKTYLVLKWKNPGNLNKNSPKNENSSNLINVIDRQNFSSLHLDVFIDGQTRMTHLEAI